MLSNCDLLKSTTLFKSASAVSIATTSLTPFEKELIVAFIALCVMSKIPTALATSPIAEPKEVAFLVDKVHSLFIADISAFVVLSVLSNSFVLEFNVFMLSGFKLLTSSLILFKVSFNPLP